MPTGFDSNFIGASVSLPRLGENLLQQAWQNGEVLDYEHFSLVMSRQTKMAFYTAHNIDRNTIKQIKRAKWKIDPRVDLQYQADNSVYKNNEWDRGHMVRRKAVCWGTHEEAKQANRDSFYYTNANLQHENYNQDEWLELEDWTLNEAGTSDKLSVFTGPINTPNDQPYRGTTIPSAFWKVIIFTKDGQLQCRAFLMKQNEFWQDKEGRDTLILQNYQVSLTQITQLTDLYFDAELYEANPLFFSPNNFTLENDIITPEMHEVTSAFDVITNRGDFTEIYQQLWELDSNAFSVTRLENGRWIDENADIKLQEQGSNPLRNRDQAELQLFSDVNTGKLESITSYRHLKSLMDNYNIRKESRESYDDTELREIDQFLDTCFSEDIGHFALMPLVYEYITTPKTQGGLGFAKENHPLMPFSSHTFGEDKCIDLTDYVAFKKTVKLMWFGLYTNHFSDVTPHCSGFEHVFVGEFSGNTIGGYHYWTKFYWDEGQEIFPHAEVNYYGAFYKNPQGKLNSDVATLAMKWKFNNHERFKGKGGFFVGLSPECMLAAGTVAAFESFHHDTDPLDAFPEKRTHRHTAINDWRYDLVIYREETAAGNKGYHIRSFFPILKSRDNVTPVLPSHSGPQVDIKLQGNIEIAAALPNPEGARDMNEWVILRNSSPAHVDLTRWQVQTNSGGSHLPDGLILPPGKEFKLHVRTNGGGGAALSNKGSTIRLLNDQEETISEVSYDKVSGRFEGTILRFSI